MTSLNRTKEPLKFNINNLNHRIKCASNLFRKIPWSINWLLFCAWVIFRRKFFAILVFNNVCECLTDWKLTWIPELTDWLSYVSYSRIFRCQHRNSPNCGFQSIFFCSKKINNTFRTQKKNRFKMLCNWSFFCWYQQFFSYF